MCRVHIQIAAVLVQYHSIGCVEGGLLKRKQRTCPRIAFGSDYGLFCDQPKPRMAMGQCITIGKKIRVAVLVGVLLGIGVLVAVCVAIAVFVGVLVARCACRQWCRSCRLRREWLWRLPFVSLSVVLYW